MSSRFPHIKPAIKGFSDILGRMPRYRFGRYGPHSKDALFVDTVSAATCVGGRIAKTSARSDGGRNISRHHEHGRRLAKFEDGQSEPQI